MKWCRRTSITRFVRRHSSRLRILGWVLIPVVVVMALSWVGARSVLLAQLADRVDRELAGEVSELRLLAQDGVDPQSGQPFADARTLLQRYLEMTIPDRNETMFAIVDGVVVARSKDTPPVRLDSDEALVPQLAAVSDVTYGRADSPAGQVSYVAVPVQAGDQRAVLVVAIFEDLDNSGLVGILGTVALIFAGTLLLAAVIGWFVAGRVLAPVRELRAAAQQISETDLSRRIPTHGGSGDDEVEDLAVTFNSMLDRLEAAFAAQRSFVDDAGHELRTPLTIVRGHLELMDGEDPVDRERTIALVQDELQRMGRIVHDLQTLTKATEPGFLRPADVDVAALTDEIVVKAEALGERRWQVDGSATGLVVIDRERVTQAMMQLAANAVQHTEPGSVIGIGSSRTGSEVRWWVRDTGSGVAPEERERVFARFARGSDADHDGVGLGLAIVAAIAVAHHGSVEVSDTVGGGATFTLVLPAFGARATAVPEREVAR